MNTLEYYPRKIKRPLTFFFSPNTMNIKRNIIKICILTVFATGLQADPSDKIETYKIEIEIVSGTKAGDKLTGQFSFRMPAQDENILEMYVKVANLQIAWNGNTVTNIKANPRVLIVDGKMKDIYFCCGEFGGKRFGVNEGFGRNQFGRGNEDFVRQGKSYFGYLNAQTYVDGVGTVKYTKVTPGLLPPLPKP